MVFGIHEKRVGFLQPKRLFYADLSRNSLNIVSTNTQKRLLVDTHSHHTLA